MSLSGGESPSKDAGLGASRHALPVNNSNPFYGGEMDNRHRDPTAIVLDASSGTPEANSVLKSYQTWHRVEDAGSKIIFHLDEINCLVRGFVKNKDGSGTTMGTVTQAKADLSIILDKILVFGDKKELVLTDKGYFLEDDSVLRFNVEGAGQKGRGPVLGATIHHPKNEKTSQPSNQKLSQLAKSKETFESALRGMTFKEFVPNIRDPGPDTEISRELEIKGEYSSKNSRCVLITGLPYGFKVSELLNLIHPTKNTLVVEVKMTKSYSGLISFYKPQGAKDFISQYPQGFITFPFEDPDLGKMEWRARLEPWEPYEPINGSMLTGQTDDFNATTTVKEADSLWTMGDYRTRAGIILQIYDGKIYRDVKTQNEVADLEFLSIKGAVAARASLQETEGFNGATFEYLPDPYVLYT
ncbi:hypothetical protein H072_10659 [Dactylellina haptotyla CBS 200.50]|uniref:Uncharacterized protein n=1 Tax=Dactylellina haptotyla (strain CBS 200.50) TaxID=1284197 RepID=S8A438_DACHA|nr:hypothetical protein H072_10659 [Dactylellina haptotyla CBS 200.50]